MLKTVFELYFSYNDLIRKYFISMLSINIVNNVLNISHVNHKISSELY